MSLKIKNKTIGLIFILYFMFMINYVSADVDYTTGGGVYGVFADGSSTNFLNLTFQFTTCSLSDCSDANFSTIYTNATFSDLSSLSNATYFQYKATFFTENQNYTPYLFNATIDYTYLDETFPLIDFVSPTPVNNSGASGSFTINVSITEENLKNVTYNWDGTVTTFNSTNESLTDLGNGNWVFTYTQTELVVGQSYSYNVSISDYAGNINSTETRTINGNTAPTFISVSYTPNSTDDLDPDINISITINISDTDDNFDSAILQWKNSTGYYGENNITMANTTAKSDYTILNATLTLPSYESNITFRIWANDTAGDSAHSENYTLESFWDCTWTVTESLGEVVGWDENKFIGNITINNTGDVQYSNNNCSLDFRISYDLQEGRIYYDGEYIKNLGFYTITPGNSNNISINASFLNEVKQETETIIIEEFRLRSEDSTKNTLLTLISTTGGPYLYQSITSTNSYSIYLTPQNLSLSSYFRNVMGNGSEERTAYNVTNNWTLPSDFLSDVPVNYTYENLSNNSLIYNNFNLVFNETNLASMSQGSYNVTLYSLGYNLSGDLITHAGNETLLSESVAVTLLCYEDATDGICVSSCGYGVDPDCPAPAVSGGGGGGGGGGNSGSRESSDAIFELLRGKEQEFILPIENKLINQSKRNVLVSIIGGANSEYVELLTTSIPEIKPQSSENVRVRITAPAYFSRGEHIIYFDIKGTIGSGKEFYERKKVTLIVVEVKRETADQDINSSKEMIKEMNESSMILVEVSKLYDQMKSAYEDYRFEDVQKYYEEILKIHNCAFEVRDLINDLYTQIRKSEANGIEIIETKKILYVGETAYKRGDYVLALERLKEAKLSFALETKGEFNIYQTIKNNPIETVGALLSAIIIGVGSTSIVRLRLLKRKLKVLADEEKLLLELMKVIQREVFDKNTMSMEEYQQAMTQYEEKLGQTIEEKITTEAKLTNMFKARGKKARYYDERKRLIKMISDLQDKYLNKGDIETRVYQNMLKSYTTRLSEIDENLAFLDAKKALKGNGLFRGGSKK